MTLEDECVLITKELRAQLEEAIRFKANRAGNFRDYYRNTGEKDRYNTNEGKVLALNDIENDISKIIDGFCNKYKK